MKKKLFKMKKEIFNKMEMKKYLNGNNKNQERAKNFHIKK